MTISIFLRKKFEHTKARHRQKPTNKTKTSKQKTTKATIFRAEKLLRGINCSFCVLVLFYTQDFFIKKMKSSR